jgi:fructose-bisphosphate aldolase class II
MTVATLKDVLAQAVIGNHALAGLVVLGWEDACAYVAAGEAVGLPVILQAGPGCRRHTPVAVLGPMFRHLAETASIPVVCHIDHARTVAECVAGIDHGFTSVMIDGSMLELAANIDLTCEVVALAGRQGVSVEGEVGLVGYAKGAASHATSPVEAQTFESQTGIDALAISIGNLHLQTEQAAIIDMTALRAIEAATHCPLVLHGGSGIPTAIRHRLATSSRVKKINIGTELRMAFGQSLRQTVQDNPTEFDRLKILAATIPALRDAAMAVMRGLG